MVSKSFGSSERFIGRQVRPALYRRQSANPNLILHTGTYVIGHPMYIWILTMIPYGFSASTFAVDAELSDWVAKVSWSDHYLRSTKTSSERNGEWSVTPFEHLVFSSSCKIGSLSSYEARSHRCAAHRVGGASAVSSSPPSRTWRLFLSSPRVETEKFIPTSVWPLYLDRGSYTPLSTA